MAGLGKLLIIAGLVLVAVGALLVFGDKLPFRIGRLPGDIYWKGKNTVVYFPLMTGLLLSIVVSVILWLVGRR